MNQIRHIIEVQVSRDSRDHSGTHWNLFAQYPNRCKAYAALSRAKGQGYKLARMVERETFELEG